VHRKIHGVNSTTRSLFADRLHVVISHKHMKYDCRVGYCTIHENDNHYLHVAKQNLTSVTTNVKYVNKQPLTKA